MSLSGRMVGNLTGGDPSNISTDTPGRIDKSAVLHSLQSSGESYDLARETLKGVSVDASGKVELEDWVEVCCNLMISRPLKNLYPENCS